MKRHPVKRRQRLGLRLLISFAALAGLLAIASPSPAATARLEPWVTWYEADTGEQNEVTISDSNVILGETSGDPPIAVEIDDIHAPIHPVWGFLWGWGCEAIHEARVWCAVEDDKIQAGLGDENDRFTMNVSSATVRTWVSGGVGDDTLVGGRGSDLLFGDQGKDLLQGGTGPDRFSGGGLNGAGGLDTVDYSNRSAPVSVTIPEPPPPVAVEDIVFEPSPAFGPPPQPQWPLVAGDDGTAGEGDDVQADVESVNGGFGSDYLRGSSADNGLHGLAGDDSLYGAGGNDFLTGGPGYDYLNGGSGDDYINGQDGRRDRVDCGSGNDIVYADRIDSFRDCDPEQILFAG